MEGRNLEIYNVCLFKTINFEELKSEMVSRQINFSPSDSYVMLTLRLRKEILQSLDIQHALVANLEKEIKIYERTKHKSGSRYDCSVPGCSFVCVHHRKYVEHLNLVHRNTNSRVVCQFRHECSRDFATVGQLKVHITRDHENHRSSVQIRQNQMVQELTSLQCSEKSCNNHKVSNILSLKKHLFSHTDKKEDTQCIFCDYRTNTTGTLKSHLSRKHRIQTVNLLNPKLVKYSGDIGESSTLEDSTQENEGDFTEEFGDESFDSPASNVEDLDDNEDIFDQEDVFVKALAITFNTWMNISGIAYTTVNGIVKEVFDSYDKGVEFSKMKIKEKLKAEEIEDCKIEEILSTMDEDDLFSVARKELETERNRKKYIFSKFPNAQPETVFLPTENGSKKESYQYVPIKESLKLLLEDQSYIKQKLEDPYNYEEGVFKDTRDGSCFQTNEFFKTNPDAVALVVFVDELEVVNPLGAAKTKHKINCTYYTCLNIQPALRSKVHSIQLVSLVRSTFWKKNGNATCNDKFIKDLKSLEEDGLRVASPVDSTVKVGLAYIVGDNLGQHNLSEISQSFSSGLICRWCKATYEDVCRESLCYSGCKEGFNPEKWTVEEYNRNADLAEESDGNDVDTCGVKRHCTFNQLTSFHCVNQMPPCLGHDYYEGVFAYDIQFYLDQMINKEKLLDAETFNKKIKCVILSERDSKNRPREFKTRKKGSKYEGNAGSIRVLSRIVTLILTSYLDQSSVGEHIVKLQEVSELITAPKLSKYEIENKLYYTVIEYLEMRVAAIEELGMDNVKPKHHFLSHYSELYGSCGPLIFLWAMRMEARDLSCIFNTYKKIFFIF